MRILLQFPEGLKQKAMELVARYEKEGHEVFLSASPCYGACDLALDEARWIKADKIVHVGHSRFVHNELDIPVEYVPYYIDVDVDSLKAVLPHIKGCKAIALATTVQHVHQFEQMKSFFERNGLKVYVEQGERAMERGQVLGCDASAITKVGDKVDAVVFIGSGIFHPLAIDIKKPVFVFSPTSGKVTNISADAERLKKLRRGAIVKALAAKSFAVLLSTKPGQFNLPQAVWASKELKKREYNCMVLVANEFDPMAIGNFMAFDCLVNTACPRIADDQEKFGKPLLNIAMLKELFAILDENAPTDVS